MDEILFLAHRVPWPPDRGDKIRSYHILQHLRRLAPVHVGAFADDARDLGFTDQFSEGLASTHIELRHKPQWLAGVEALVQGTPISLRSFASRSAQQWVNERLASGCISHIYCFSSQMAQYVPPSFTGQFVMDFVDVDSAKFDSYALDGSVLMRLIYQREGRLLEQFETEVARRAHSTLFASAAEADLFRKRSGAQNVHVVGNGIDTDFYDPTAAFKTLHPPYADPLIIFTGQMDYRPNIEAVTAFATDTMPIIRASIPEATFAIVGRNPSAAVNALSALPGVQVTGAVDDIRSWLAAADVVVAPLRTARGVQNKILEAMAMAKPVIASPPAAEGIYAQPGSHFFVEQDAAGEAARVCALLNSPAEMQRIGQAARAHVIAHYSWQTQLAPLGGLLNASVKTDPSAVAP